MGYTIITSEHFQTLRWPGGTSTELFIFPITAEYHLRNFQFRLSTATVEKDKSDFTQLSRISRKIMILAGNIILSHENLYSRNLNKFDVDEFEGDWKTSSVGKCTDFNLMTAGKTTGDLNAVIIEKEHSVIYDIKENRDWVFIYVFSGKIRISINNKIDTIKKGSLLILDRPSAGNFEINGIENSELVFSEIIL
jgi:environmental stress-induced protein Ves